MSWTQKCVPQFLVFVSVNWHLCVILVNSYWPFLFNTGQVTLFGFKRMPSQRTAGCQNLPPLKRPAQWRTLCPPPWTHYSISLIFTATHSIPPFMDNRAGTSRTLRQYHGCISPVWTSLFDAVVNVIYGEHNWNWRLCIVCSKLKDYSVVFVHFKPVFNCFLSFTWLLHKRLLMCIYWLLTIGSSLK